MTQDLLAYSPARAKDDGLFILETMTPRILKAANSYRCKKMVTSGVREFSKGYYYDIGIAKGNILTWDARIFERLPKGLYQLHKYKLARALLILGTSTTRSKSKFRPSAKSLVSNSHR